MPWLASPAIASPAATLTVSGRNSGIATAMAARPTNSPLFGDLVEEGGPAPGVRRRRRARIATAIRIGISASAPSIAHVRHRRNCVASSLPSRLQRARPRSAIAHCGGRSVPRRTVRPRLQATTSKPSPVSSTKRCSRLAPTTSKPRTRTPAGDERRDDRLGRDAVGHQSHHEHRASDAASRASASTPSRREHRPRVLDVRRAHLHPRRARPSGGTRRACPARPGARRS